MLALERQRKIIQTLVAEGHVLVASLSRQFGVTEETIRRDLGTLELAGRLRRSHGGAVPVIDDGAEIPHAQRERVNQALKESIAREALKQIKEGQSIILDASSTAWFLARMIPDLRLTVITNAVLVVNALAPRRNVQVICTGGTLFEPSLSFMGPVAEHALEALNADLLFLSCRGIDLDRGLSDALEPQASLKRAMLRAARRRVLMVDHTKFGRRSLAVIDRLETVDAVFSDAGLPDETAAELSRRGLELIRAS